MAEMRFTTQEHEHLANIPLKGEMLREFVTLSREGIELKTLGFGKQSPVYQNPQNVRNTATIKKVVDALTEGLDEKDALTHGIDLKDMESIVRRAAKQDVNKVELSEALKKTAKGYREAKQDEVSLSRDETAMAQAISHIMMAIFSMCLAKQEGEEDAFLATSDKIHENAQQSARTIRQHPSFGGGMIDRFLGEAAGGLVTVEQSIAVAKARKSPITELFEQAIYGREYPRTRVKGGVYDSLNYAIKTFGDIDDTTRAGQERIRMVRDETLRQARAYLHITSREVS